MVCCRPRVLLLYDEPIRPMVGEEHDWIAERGVLESVEAVKQAFEKLRYLYDVFAVRDDLPDLIGKLKECGPDVVFNLCESVRGDSGMEMNIPAFLEIVGVPYTGSPPLALGLCRNKAMTKAVLTRCKVLTPRWRVLTEADDCDPEDLRFPVIVKPVHEDAGVGIGTESVVFNDLDLRNRVRYVNETYKQPALVEEYVEGRELNVALLGNADPRVLPISEVLFVAWPKGAPKVVGFSAKWLPSSREYAQTAPICPAPLDWTTEKRVKDCALRAYRTLGLSGYGRIDMRLTDDGTIYVLEVNPNPDISPNAGMMRSVRALGLTYEQFVEKVIEFGLDNFHQRESNGIGLCYRQLSVE